MRLLNENEIPNLEDPAVRFAYLNEKLSDLIEYKYELNGSPFTCVFQLLDEIGKKLDWPNLPLNSSTSIQTIEEKLTSLLLFKQKPDKQANISVSSLNKQFSFYAITLFFKKLIEFNAVAKEHFNSRLVMARKFKYNPFNMLTVSAINPVNIYQNIFLNCFNV